MAPRRKLQRKLLLAKLLQNSRRRKKEIQQKILLLLIIRRMLSLEVFFFVSALLISSKKTTDRFLVFLHLVLYGQLMKYFRQKVVRLLMQTTCTKSSHVCYKPFSTPVLTLLIPGRHVQRSSGVINRLNAHADTRENTFPKFMH